MKTLVIHMNGEIKYTITYNNHKGPESSVTSSNVLTLNGANAPKMDPELNGKITFTGDAPLSGTINRLLIKTIGQTIVKLEW